MTRLLSPSTLRRTRGALCLASVVVIACAASWDSPMMPLSLRALVAPLDSTHAVTQRRRLDSVAVQLARYCKTNKPASYVCGQRARLDSARSAEVYTPASPIDTTPTTPPRPPVPTGVVVQPGQSIQAAVDANPAGTTFLLKAGTHVQQSVAPKAGDVFVGEGMGVTILDGQNITPYAFNGYNGAAWVNTVTIRTLTVTRYASPSQMGAIRAIDYDRTQSTSGWTVDSVEVSYSKSIGVKMGTRMRVLRSNLHHNGTINIGGTGTGMLVDGTRSTDGNPGCVNNPGFESGGSKFAGTDSLIVRNSTFSNNCGVGLWLDIENKNYLLENNRVEDNYREGICVEISYAGIVRNNQVNRNGVPVDPYRNNGWGWDAGIGIHASSGVEVSGNTLTENFNGIVALQQNRGNGSDGQPYLVQNLSVHDNTIYQRTPPPGGGVDGSFSGAVQDVGDNALFTSRNNRWVNNTYYLGTNARPFTWMNCCARTPAEWRGYGQDVTGVFNP